MAALKSGCFGVFLTCFDYSICEFVRVDAATMTLSQTDGWAVVQYVGFSKPLWLTYFAYLLHMYTHLSKGNSLLRPSMLQKT